MKQRVYADVRQGNTAKDAERAEERRRERQRRLREYHAQAQLYALEERARTGWPV